LRQQPASEGPGRARVRDAAGPAGQEPALAKAGELRLAGISAVEAANAWLPEFIEDYNRRFSRAPANPKDLHRPLTQADDLNEILAWREARTVTRNLTLRYDRMMLLLDPTPFARGLAGKKVEVVNYPDGRFAVRHEGIALPFRVFDKIRTVVPGAIVENKRLGEALAFARELQASYPPNRRRGDPRRRRPPNNLEAPGLPSKGRAPRDAAATTEADLPRVASGARQPIGSRSAEPFYEPSELTLAR
jgi:hypothetical protein